MNLKASSNLFESWRDWQQRDRCFFLKHYLWCSLSQCISLAGVNQVTPQFCSISKTIQLDLCNSSTPFTSEANP
uniref:Uncharacterized protein n=1 Tax=Noccaea caerulescens TaxID=107243 RepID=A0A1J3FDV8_NOCCA